MDNIYTGKSSRNPNKPLIWALILGIVLIVFGVTIYFDLAAWENSNEEKHLHSLIWAIYDMGGKLAVGAVFSTIGLSVIGVGYKKSKDLKEIVKNAKYN
ncbi:hypothetical protein [Maribacter sp.]|uniref:hypothetical protein n=1 Tax=Maribacter sp. TaxID=1897614 RepID=UPI0025C4F80A|nr:hypothetical protein [Maribacter sp.]